MERQIQTTAIKIENVKKQFGFGESAVTALADITIDILDNEFFTLLGPSGCGKTTLLRMIAGLESVTTGTISLYGQEIKDLPANKRPVNTVFQQYALFPHMTVLQNIGFGLKMMGKSKSEIIDRSKKMLGLVQLGQFGDRRPSQLSGGQQQRVALARALAPSPKVLLLDEPLSALDLKLRQAMRVELKQIQEETGITFVFVTHDQEEALTMSDRIAVMSKGQVLQVESPADLYERPNSRFVAGFIGNMNFFDGRVQKIDEGTTFVDAGPLGAVEARIDNGAPAGTDVVVAIRPQKLKLHLKAPGESANTVEGRMGPAAYLGDRSHLNVLVPGREQPVAVAVQNMEGSELTASDQPVWLSFAGESVVLLRSE